MLIHIDTKGYTEKPKEHISIIKPRLQGANTIKDIDLETLIKYIQRGYSISPAVMDGKGCKAENWKEQRLFMVDIDNDKSDKPVLSVSNALEICNRYNLPPAFYYYSFSHSEQKEKYRLCFVMNETVTNQALRAVIAQTLVKLFPQSDTSCTNADRIFYGTNKDVVICDLSTTIDIENVLKLQEPQQQKQVKTGNEELDRLKEDFDFFRYLQERNGKTVFNNSKCAMFERCEICGHKKDLVYYHETKTFNCFGASGNVGGSIIDYIKAVEKTDLKGAIDRLYELSGITRPSKKENTKKTVESFNFFTVSNLTDEEKIPPEFIVESLVPVGLTFISGAPKLRKSFLALQLASAVATGTDFLSFKTKQCTVCYFDLEGSKSRISSRSDKMGIVMPDNLLISNTLENGIADGLIEQLSALLDNRQDIRLIILDTYSRARGTFKTYGANAYDSDVQLLSPLQRFAINKKIAVLCVHHDKKGAGFCNDTFERLSGTMGISGSCDSVLNLIGDGKRFDGRATLEYCPRDVKGGELKLCFDDSSCRWKISEFTEENNPFVLWVKDNIPDKSKSIFIPYAEAYSGAYHKYSEKPHEAILKAVAENKQLLFSEYDVAIQTGVKSNDKRGIRIFRV